ALFLNPQLVIADEPTTALDLTVQRQVLETLKRLTVDSGRSMLMVTHDLGVVWEFCDRVLVMYKGQIVEHGAVAEVFVNPQHDYTASLLDSVTRPARVADDVARSLQPVSGLTAKEPTHVNN